MNPVKVCAIILDYFGADKTEACLRSLIGQGLETICVVDNSAAPGASAELHDAIDRLRPSADYQIEILSPGQNLGFAKGVNYALHHQANSQSRHDYYLLINNDAIAGPDLVRGLLSTLQTDPQAALVAPKILSSDIHRELGIWYHRYLGLLLANPGGFRFHYFTGCCLMFPRRLTDDRELFDNSFFMYGEDTELGWRLLREDQKTLAADNVYVEHEYGPSVERSSFFYEYHMNRCHLLLSLKTWRYRAEIPLLLATKYLALWFRAVARSLRHRSITPLLALSVASLPISASRIQLGKTS